MESDGYHVHVLGPGGRQMKICEEKDLCDSQVEPDVPQPSHLHAPLSWVAVEELHLSYHNTDIEYILWFLDCGNIT